MNPIDHWTFPGSKQLGMVAAGTRDFGALASIVKAARAAGSTDAEIESWIRYPNGITLIHDATTCTIAAMAAHVDPVDPFVFYLDDEAVVVACLEQDNERTVFRLILPSDDVRRVTVQTPRFEVRVPRYWMNRISDAMIAGGLV